MRWPLRYQILIPLAGLMLAALVSVSVLNAWWAAERTERQIEDQLRGVARTLLGSSFPLTEPVLTQMHGLAGAEFVLSDADGQVLATSGRACQRMPRPDHVADRWQELRLGERIMLDDTRFFRVALRVNERGSASDRGLLHILYPEKVLRDALRNAAIPPLVVGAVALVLCVAVATLLAQKFSRPILEIRSQVGRLAQGDFRLLPVPLRNDELRDLATSVNELARQLDEMRRAIARAERLSLLGRLSAGLAHNLRNDVAGARMAVQMHQRHCRTLDQESLDVALRQLNLTEEHLKRFLAAGQPVPLCRTTFLPHELIEELLTLLAPAARHRRCELAYDDQAPQTAVCADRDQLRQAMMNLILNALEAVAREGSIRVESAIAAGGLRLRVFDSGPGLSSDLIDRWGEAFLTTKPEGVGLGLAVARQVAAAHGGHLRYARSTEETCFELWVPCDAVAPQTTAPAAQAIAAATSPQHS